MKTLKSLGALAPQMEVWCVPYHGIDAEQEKKGQQGRRCHPRFELMSSSQHFILGANHLAGFTLS